MRRAANVPALVLAVLAAFGAPRAHAYCRSRTVRESACDERDEQGCPSCGKPLFWRSRCVGFSIQEDASKQVSYDAVSRAVSAAFARWATAPCVGGTASVDARNLGPVSCAKVGFNTRAPNQNTITFRDGAWKPEDPNATPGGLRGETIALTTTSYNTRTGELVGADMEINSAQFAFSASGEPAPTSFDLEAVVTHEAGHFLGLAHTPDTAAVMYAGGEPGRTLQRELKADDLSAICGAYPADGTRAVDPSVSADGSLAATACDPIPTNGLTTVCATNPAPSCSFRASRRRSSGGTLGAFAPLLAAFFLRRRFRAIFST
jgi:hypothetical protein